jgi:hypothetical protein
MSDVGDVTRIPRRKLLQLAPAAFLVRLNAETCTNNHHGSDETKPYTVQFFTADEMKLLDAVMEKIIPADDHSPGAHEAGVPLFADLMVATSPDDVKEDWRGGLRVLETELETSSLDEWLARASTNQEDPLTVLDLFFVKLKQMTVDGYYTSSIGIHKDLEYQGNTYLREFHGCTHPEHQA